MTGGNNFRYNIVLNVMTINLNVLRTLMRSEITSDEDSGLIITMHGSQNELMRSLIAHRFVSKIIPNLPI